jgi:putative membrane protein
MMGFGFLFMIIVWGVIIAAAVWVGRYLLNINGDLNNVLSNTRKKSALEILENRYARGEITRDEFESMKKDIA